MYADFSGFQLIIIECGYFSWKVLQWTLKLSFTSTSLSSNEFNFVSLRRFIDFENEKNVVAIVCAVVVPVAVVVDADVVAGVVIVSDVVLLLLV